MRDTPLKEGIVWARGKKKQNRVPTFTHERGEWIQLGKKNKT